MPAASETQACSGTKICVYTYIHTCVYIYIYIHIHICTRQYYSILYCIILNIPYGFPTFVRLALVHNSSGLSKTQNPPLTSCTLTCRVESAANLEPASQSRCHTTVTVEAVTAIHISILPCRSNIFIPFYIPKPRHNTSTAPTLALHFTIPSSSPKPCRFICILHLEILSCLNTTPNPLRGYSRQQPRMEMHVHRTGASGKLNGRTPGRRERILRWMT